MAKQADIYIRTSTAVDAHAPNGNADTLRSSVGQLIAGGNVIAVGDEAGIIKTFDNEKDWSDWFNGLNPKKEPQ